MITTICFSIFMGATAIFLSIVIADKIRVDHGKKSILFEDDGDDE